MFVGSDRTPVAALTARARELWEHLAGTAAGLTPLSVAVSPRSYLCPPGWVGIVVIGDAFLATAPDHETARLLRQALSGLPAASLTGTDVLSRRLPTWTRRTSAPGPVTSPRRWSTLASGISCWRPTPMT
jgi:hypothetical protein